MFANFMWFTPVKVKIGMISMQQYMYIMYIHWTILGSYCLNSQDFCNLAIHFCVSCDFEKMKLEQFHCSNVFLSCSVDYFYKLEYQLLVLV